jgi:hypothetical protein
MTFDAKTVTREQLETLSADELKPFMVSLVSAYEESKNPATQIGDLSRLELRREFYDKAYGHDKIILPRSHAEYLEDLKDGPRSSMIPQSGASTASAPVPGAKP